jgi:hypothetical protein
MKLYRRSIPEIVDEVLKRKEEYRPTEGVIHAIDGDRVDLRVNNSSSVLRYVEVVGTLGNAKVGDTVPIRWRNLRPVVMLLSDGTIEGSSGLARVVADEQSIENSISGLRVKTGGIGLGHLNFSPALEGHQHQHEDPFSKAGWKVSDAGTIWQGDTYIFADGQIALGTGADTIKLSSNDPSYRIWGGAVVPEVNEDGVFLGKFALKADGSIIARLGEIAGWTIATDYLEADSGAAKIQAGTNPYLALGAATDYLTGTGFWVGKHSGSYKLHLGDPTGIHLKWDASALTVDQPVVLDGDIQMFYDAGRTIKTIHLETDGDASFGSDLSAVATTVLKIFSNAQIWATESFGAGDIHIGDHSAANMLWDQSAGQLKFRGGTTIEVYIDTDGTLNAGGGELWLDSTGFHTNQGDGSTVDPNPIRWHSGKAGLGGKSAGTIYTSNQISGFYDDPLLDIYAGLYDSGTPSNMNNTATIYVRAFAYDGVSAPHSTSLEIKADPSGTNETMVAIWDTDFGYMWQLNANRSTTKSSLTIGVDFFNVTTTDKFNFNAAWYEFVTGHLVVYEYFQIKDLTSLPGTPAAGWGYLYSKNADGKLYWHDGSTEYDLTAGAGGMSAHVLADTTGLGTYHTTSGLTAGQVLRATGATTAAFQSLVAGDIPTLDHGSALSGLDDDDHGAIYPGISQTETITGAWTKSTNPLILNNNVALQVKTLAGVPGNALYMDVLDDLQLGVSGYPIDLVGSAINMIALGSNWDAGAFEIRALKFYSDQATGTAPFTVLSTTKVTNLNADLLDDQSGAYYLNSANFTGTNWTDLTDAGETTLHTHPAAAPAAHVLATSGPHTGELPWTDMAAGTRGGIVRRGISDWEEYALGTTNYVLKAGALDVAWGQVAFSELTGDIVYTQLDSIVDISGGGSANLISAATHVHTDADGSTKVTYSNLSGIPSTFAPSAHDIEGAAHTASGLTIGHVMRASGAAAFSFAALQAGDIPALAYADDTESFVVMALSGGLSNERRLQGTANQITLSDGGAGGDATLSLPSTLIWDSTALTLQTTTSGDIVLDPFSNLVRLGGAGVSYPYLWNNTAGSLQIGSGTTDGDYVFIATYGHFYIDFQNDAAGVDEIKVRDSADAEVFTIDSDGNVEVLSSLVIGTVTTAPDGPLHVFEGSAGAVAADSSADTAVFESSGDGGLTILTPNANWGGFYFGSPANPKAAWLSYNQSSSTFGFEGPAGGTMKFNGLLANVDYIFSGDTEQVLMIDAGADSVILGPKTSNAMPDTTTYRLMIFSDGAAPTYPIGTVTEAASNITQFLSTGTSASFGSGFLARYTRGTFASPTQTQSGDRLGFFLFGGIDNVGGWGNQAGFLSYTTQAYTATARGTKFQILATAQNAASRGVVMEFFGEGHIDSFGGTSNPTTNISAGSLFFRTDLHMWIEYDGTRWLTTHEYFHSNDYTTASSTGTVRIAPLRSDYGIYVTNVECNFYISGTNNASNYWTIALRGAEVDWSALDTFHSYATNGDSGSTWITSTGAPNTKNIPTNYKTFAITLTKTLTPGNCLYNVGIYYKLIVT